MMGTRGKCDGDEWDAFSRNSRRLIRWHRGRVQGIKARFWRRQRAAQHCKEHELVKRSADGEE